MKQWKLTLAALAATFALAACSDSLPTGPSSDEVAQPSLFRGGLNGEFARLADQVPGFGGMYYGPDGKLNVVVAAGHNPVSVTRGLARAIRGPLTISAKVGGAALDEMVVQDGSYDFGQLSRWYNDARKALGFEGVVFTDIDERNNRIRIGVRPNAPADEIQEMLSQAGIPAEAVILEPSEPVVALKGNTLRERVQPFGGGLQLLFPNPMPGFVSVCTLGFNILLSEPGHSTDYFMTNSHCTLERGVLDGTPYHQQPVAVLDPKMLIATEYLDLPFIVAGCPYAPLGFVCRISDAAIARYETARTPVKFGAIYRTAFPGIGGAAGSIEIEGGPKWFRIVDEEPFPLGGEVLDKVGRTTGWTRGTVIGTCIDTGVSGTNIAMICQDFVAAGVGGGDSGSPVFEAINDTEARLYGILWGGSDGLYVFSAMDNIRAEFGPGFRTH